MESEYHRKVKEVFERAEKIAPEEREAYLAEACGDDAQLRADVERLLRDAADTPESSLEPSERIEPPSMIEIGQEVTHYRIVGRLGRGGMGEVWEAEDSKLKRRVALKVLTPELAGHEERLKRFQREAEVVAALNHPNIVTIHSVEETEGMHFLTMELVEGQSLTEKLPQGGFELDKFFEIAVPLAGAVAAAHQKCILHRDLKPSNVMVTDEGHVKVLDFGLAGFEQGPGGIESSQLPTKALTAPGVVMGTASYMSPEQVEGKPLDHRTDIFSLGVVLYEMATGEHPFEGESSAAVMGSILRDHPSALSETRSDLPRHLGRIVTQCLEKNPLDRFQSARDVYNGLRNLQKEMASDPSWSSSAQIPAATAPRKSVGRWVSAGLATVLTLAIALWWVARHKPSSEAPSAAGSGTEAVEDRKLLAVLPLQNLGPTEDEYFAAGITDEIISRLATVRGLGVLSSGSTSKFQASDLMPTEVGQELGVEYLLTGSVRWARRGDGTSQVRISPKLIRIADDTLLWAEVYDRSMDDIFKIQSDIAISVAHELGSTLVAAEKQALEIRPTENQDAYQAYLRGRTAAVSVGCATIRDGIGDLERAVELDPGFVKAWAAVSKAHSGAFAHCPERAEEDRTAALAALNRAQQLAPGTWEVLESESKFLGQVERDYERALAPLEEASRLIDNSEIHHALGSTYRRMGRWDEAVSEFEQGFLLDPTNPYLLSRVAASHHWIRNYSEAVEFYDRGAELAPQFVGFYSLRKAWAYWLWKGDTEEARGVLEALPGTGIHPSIQWSWFWQRVYEGSFHEAIDGLTVLPDDQMVETNIFLAPKSLLKAQAYALMGETELARRSFEEARTILESEVEKYPSDARYWQALAIAYAGLGRREEAAQTAVRVTDLVPIAKEPYFGSSTLQEVALVYTMIGDFDTALDDLETLLAMPSTVTIAWLKLDPRWAPLWDHPRFHELEAKYG